VIAPVVVVPVSVYISLSRVAWLCRGIPRRGYGHRADCEVCNPVRSPSLFMSDGLDGEGKARGAHATVTCAPFVCRVSLADVQAGWWAILRPMSVTIRIDWDQAAIHQLLYGESGLVHRKVREVTERVADRCRVLAPNRDGTLRSSIRTAVRVSGTKVVGHVYSDLDYSVYVQRVTGLYGPAGRPIRPRRSPFL